MSSQLTTTVRRVTLPDFRYVFETATKGMDVTCRVIELKGQYEITREMYMTNKSKHRWFDYVARFEQLAIAKYQINQVGLSVTKNTNITGSL